MTASECLEHIWLKRRVKPAPPQKQQSIYQPINQIVQVMPSPPEPVIIQPEPSPSPPPIPELPALALKSSIPQVKT